MRLVYSGLDAAHSSMAICNISSRPHALMQCAMPDRSMSCPISSSSGTSVASSSRESAAYLLFIESASRAHLDGRVDVGLLVHAVTLGRRLLPLARNATHHSIEPRRQREADVLGQEDRHLLELGLGQLVVLECRVDLYLGEVLETERRHHRQRHQSLVAHGKSWPGPDVAEEVVDGEREEVIAFDVGHLPRVDLVHLVEALATLFVHAHSFVVDAGWGTPRPAARFRNATLASGRSTSTASPNANARLRSFSPRPRVCVNASCSQCSGANWVMSSRTMIAPGPPVWASLCRTTRPRACRLRPAASANCIASHAAA